MNAGSRQPIRGILPSFAPAFVILASSAASAQPRYTIVDLTELAAPLGVAQCEGTAINEAGQVVGFEALPEFRTQAIFWDQAGLAQLLPLIPDDNSSWTHGINNNGVIAGASELVTVEYIGHQIRIHVDDKAVLWDAGAPIILSNTVIGGDPIDLHRTWDVNDNGLIIGWGRPAGSSTGSKGWLLENGVVTDLGALDNPVTLNHQRQIVGYTFGSQSDAYLWDNGVLTNLHDHPLITGVTSRAWGLNESGLIVGEAQFHISQPESPTLWREGVPQNLLVPRFGRPQGQVFAINNHDVLVGWVNDLDNLNDQSRAFIIDENGQYHDLIDLVEPGLGWDQLIIPWDINDRGQIVGGGRRFGQIGHGFLLTPILPGDLNGDGHVDLVDLGILLADFGCMPPAECVGDVDGDGDTDLADLGVLLANFGR